MQYVELPEQEIRRLIEGKKPTTGAREQALQPFREIVQRAAKLGGGALVLDSQDNRQTARSRLDKVAKEQGYRVRFFRSSGENAPIRFALLPGENAAIQGELDLESEGQIGATGD